MRGAHPAVVVVGGGAMGGLLAARLAAAGVPASVLDVDAALVRAIEADGLRVEGDAPVSGRPRAATDPGDLPPADLLFVFVKAHHTASAAQLVRPLVGGRTVVATLQNGWGNADVLAEVFPPERLVVGVTYHSATVAAPGRIAHTGRGPTFVGPYRPGDPLTASEEVARVLASADIEATVTKAVLTEIWRKLVLNAAALPVAALTGLRAAELARPSPALDLVDALAAEAVAVARGLGHAIELSERLERIHATLAGAGLGKPSMLQDVEARRKTEVDVINGAVMKLARELGTPVPLNEAMVALVHGLERSWER